MSGHDDARDATTSHTSEGTPPHLLFILIDTLRQDYVGGPNGDLSQTETPTILGHMADGFIFTNCQSQAPWTKPSVGSLFTSRYPTAHGALRGQAHTRDDGIAADPLPPQHETLAEQLRENGYRTMALQTNPNLTEAFGFDQGFETFHYEYDAPAETVTDLAIDWMREAVRAPDAPPLFLYVHYMDPHLPYQRHPGESYPAYDGVVADTMVVTQLLDHTWTDEDRTYFEALYRGEVHHVDREVGRLIEAWKELPSWSNSQVWVTSDHGEEFWEHGGFEHGHTLYDELLRVPLLAGGPGLRATADEAGPRRIVAQVRVIDIMPTLLEFASIAPAVGGQGQSFAPLFRAQDLPARTAFAEGLLYQEQRWSVRTVQWKSILNIAARTVELYDVLSDPAERTDLAPQQAGLVQQFKSAAGQWYLANKALGEQLSAPDPVALSPEQRERLRSLGYTR